MIRRGKIAVHRFSVYGIANARNKSIEIIENIHDESPKWAKVLLQPMQYDISEDAKVLDRELQGRPTRLQIGM